ncbi:hypothetical protein L2E82_08560 [Cichorium intybus]|uniref:Uncharacterized protein n=1 Tax=Cichorium intybus TaxID=13427 RepID=A0ACB9G8J9_CICIN|nr:hypothetical protein L2E82_08560 [Cichorium intybus]
MNVGILPIKAICSFHKEIHKATTMEIEKRGVRFVLCCPPVGPSIVPPTPHERFFISLISTPLAFAVPFLYFHPIIFLSLIITRTINASPNHKCSDSSIHSQIVNP